MPDEGVLSAPIYDVGEVARLAQLPSGKVRRWVKGYSFPVGPERRRREQEPVLQRGVSAPEQASFLDLIELRLARAFLQDGFSLQRLRLAFREAAEVTGLDHPFARKRVLTSGGKIFLEVQAPRRRSPKHLLELLSGGQWVIPEIVETYANQIDFDPTSEAASRWWPLGRENPIIIDPRHSFGAPSLKRGITTGSLLRLYRGEGRNALAVANWMNVPLEEVEAAIRFEREWSKQLAA